MMNFQVETIIKCKVRKSISADKGERKRQMKDGNTKEPLY